MLNEDVWSRSHGEALRKGLQTWSSPKGGVRGDTLRPINGHFAGGKVGRTFDPVLSPASGGMSAQEQWTRHRSRVSGGCINGTLPS